MASVAHDLIVFMSLLSPSGMALAAATRERGPRPHADHIGQSGKCIRSSRVDEPQVLSRGGRFGE
jgi:hypothetical protein